MGATDDNMGARIRAARAFAGITSHEKLGKQIGLGRDAVLAMEKNQRMPTVAEVRTIANATGVPIGFLINGWSASGRLSQRVEALEAEVKSGSEDREDLAKRIDELDASLEKRLAEFAAQVLQRRRSQRRREDPPGEEGEPAQ